MVRTFIFVCFLCATLLLITVFLTPLGNTLRQTIPISRLALGRLRNKELESAAENNTRNVTQKPFVILVYTEFFGTKEWLKITDDCSSPEIPRNSCRKDMFDLTYDKKRYAESEFVIFHARDMPGVDHLKTIMKNKPSSQFWIYFLQESPNATPDTRPLNGMFDLTMTYRSDSDFRWPYGSYREIPFEKTSQLDFSVGKDKLVSWMVSNCNSHLRNSFVHELQKYIAVDVFGSCSGQFGKSRSCPHGETCRNIIKQYKFYLSFENALCEDYITEKYWGRIGKQAYLRNIGIDGSPVFSLFINKVTAYVGQQVFVVVVVCLLWGGGGVKEVYYRQKITEKCHRTSSCQPPFFINNIYYNICSKSLKGSSRELTLFTLNI